MEGQLYLGEILLSSEYPALTKLLLKDLELLSIFANLHQDKRETVGRLSTMIPGNNLLPSINRSS